MLPSRIFTFSIALVFITSTALQVIRTIFGSFRKRCSKKWLIFLLWSAYQLADVVPTVGLGVIASAAVDPKVAYVIGSMLSSFLLLHLGGPDSITAISLVDNELCSRHLLQLVYRVGVAGYIQVKLFVLINGEADIAFLAGVLITPFIVLFLAGTSKYVERTWVLHSANMTSLRDSMLPPNPGPRPTILNDGGMEEAQAQAPVEGTSLRDSMLPPNLGPGAEPLNLDDDHDHISDATEAHSISVPMPLDEYNSGMVAATASGKRTSLRYFFLNDEDDDYNDIADAQSISMPMDEYASRMAAPASTDETLLEEQLDSNKAILLRGHHYFCNFKCLFVDLMVPYSHVIDSKKFFLQYPCDVAFQLMLFTKAPVAVAFDTTTLWWYNNFMAQCNLLSLCFKDGPKMLTKIPHLCSRGKSIYEWVQKNKNTTYMHVPKDIKDFIYQQFKEMVQTSAEEIESAEFRNYRGKWIMRRNDCGEHHCLEELGWSVDVELDRGILI